MLTNKKCVLLIHANTDSKKEKESCCFLCSPLSPIQSFSTSPELWRIHQIALFFVTTHLHVCLCMRACGCSVKFCNPAHNVQSRAANVPQASHAYYSYYCWFWKISRQDIPLRLQRLSSSTSNTSQIYLKHHTPHIAGELCFRASIKGGVFQRGTWTSWFCFVFDSSPNQSMSNIQFYL